MYKNIVKRMIDIVLSGLGIIVLSPILLVLVVAIKMDSKGPVLFKQKRVGIHKSHFNILKFRTMRIDTPKDMPTHLLQNPEQWITKVGGFLRKTSLDELPQIFNVLRGEMSLAGPRPVVQEELDKYYGEAVKEYASVKPGITGLWQVSGRSDVDYPERVAMDVEYVRTRNLWKDIVILYKTFDVVLNKKGAY